MRDRDAFGNALQALRQRLRDGAYAPGAPLVIIELAHELNISATPMREALARLAGEGLIEDRRGVGLLRLATQSGGVRGVLSATPPLSEAYFSRRATGPVPKGGGLGQPHRSGKYAVGAGRPEVCDGGGLRADG